MRGVIREETEERSKADNAKKTYLECRNTLAEADNIAERHRNRKREVHTHTYTHTHTLVIVPVQAMRSLSDYRRVIEW